MTLKSELIRNSVLQKNVQALYVTLFCCTDNFATKINECYYYILKKGISAMGYS